MAQHAGLAVLSSPCQVLCVVPYGSLQWSIVSLASLISSAFVLKTVWPSIRDQAPGTQGRTIVLATFAAQVAFGILLKVYFFSPSIQ